MLERILEAGFREAGAVPRRLTFTLVVRALVRHGFPRIEDLNFKLRNVAFHGFPGEFQGDRKVAVRKGGCASS